MIINMRGHFSARRAFSHIDLDHLFSISDLSGLSHARHTLENLRKTALENSRSEQRFIEIRKAIQLLTRIINGLLRTLRAGEESLSVFLSEIPFYLVNGCHPPKAAERGHTLFRLSGVALAH